MIYGEQATSPDTNSSAI